MATLFQKRGIWYMNYVVDGRRYKVSTGTSNKKLAQVKFDDLKVKLFKGEIGAPAAVSSGASVAQLLHRFTDYCHANYAPDHLQSDLSRIKTMQDFFARQGIKYLTAITPGVIEKFMTVVLAGRSAKTKKNYLALLKTALNYAVKWGVIKVNPIAMVSPPKIVKRFHFFSAAEVSKLVEHAEEPLKTSIIILVNTGLRRAELFNLRWRDLDLKNKRLRVWPYKGFTPKGKAPRSIPLNSTALKAIKNLRLKNGDAEGYVCRPYDSIHTLRRQFTVQAKKLKMKGTLHNLRHTFASHLAMAGTPIPDIKELLGHSDISTTMIYAHLSPDRHKAEVEKLPF